ERVDDLQLPMMVDENRSSRSTAFTISIEAREGVTTGISAADRAHTIRTAVDPKTTARDLVSPGHIFPLRAKRGGVLQRTGHTEGAVDLARLAGCSPAGVICEIMKDDGTMARRDDLLAFAAEHGLPLLSMADIVQYRLETEEMVRSIRSGEIVLASGCAWHAHVYETSADDRQILALTLGEIDQEPTLVRVHTGSVLGDVFQVESGGRIVMADALRRIEAEGKGVVLFLPGRIHLDADLAFHLGEDVPRPPVVEHGAVLREYGLGAQVLKHLGLGKIRLLTNRPRRIAGLEGYGLEVIEQLLLREPAEAVHRTEGHTTH
ncbi:MAG: 3,4-dihydroxy-2-butanone-4-phosphate synthase, partial [Myxococcales bacterium]|nr:3,4-dihydroxy-2-butanone-4-phosphate synthase [Myxococcales bacterium]